MTAGYPTLKAASGYWSRARAEMLPKGGGGGWGGGGGRGGGKQAGGLPDVFGYTEGSFAGRLESSIMNLLQAGNQTTIEKEKTVINPEVG